MIQTLAEGLHGTHPTRAQRARIFQLHRVRNLETHFRVGDEVLCKSARVGITTGRG